MRRPRLPARRIAVAVGGCMLLTAVWWTLRAPAIEHHAVAPPPDIDIDPPAMRARREAALALATMPDDPWALAESLAPSAPAASVTKDNCGIEGRPTFAETGVPAQAPVQTGGASSRYATAQARIDAALRSSVDPLDRAVADLVNVGEMRTESGRTEAFVQQAAASTDARLYSLGYRLCHSYLASPPGCASITLDRWLQLDADNGVPWLARLSEARAQGDAAGVRSAMSHLESATRFDVYLQVAAGAVASRAAKDDPDLAAVNDLAFKASAVEAVLPQPAYASLMQACRDKSGGDVELAQACRTISDTLFEHSDNLMGQSIGGALLLQTTGDASRRDFIRAERAVARARWSPATGFSECRSMRDSLDSLVRTAKVGEVEAMRERARQFVTP